MTGARAVARTGDPWARLLAGPPRESGREALPAHVARLGAAPVGSYGAHAFAELLLESGLGGRGGGEFLTGRKVETVLATPGRPVVVVNASESEPASRKDRLLLELRPHLVLDGAALAAAALGATEAVVYTHAGRHRVAGSLTRALAERGQVRTVDPRWRIAVAPERYVSGESTAVVSFLSGGSAIPRKLNGPVAHCGVGGRPTLLSNAETFAHIALIARFGAPWFRQAGSASSPGSTLVTLAGAVRDPGEVVEICAPVTFAELLTTAGGLAGPPAALLLGGYAGNWFDGGQLWPHACDRGELRRAGAGLGCGLVGVLAPGSCGLAETARLLGYLARETAGQCGPCVFGLPTLAAGVAELAAGDARAGDVRRLHKRMALMRRSGACAHPDGAVNLAESALHVFREDVARHVRGRPCPPSMWRTSFPVPAAAPPHLVPAWPGGEDAGAAAAAETVHLASASGAWS